MNYDEMKPAPDKTGWYISICKKSIVNTITYQHFYFEGPYADKASAVSDLRDMIKDHLPDELIEYLVAYYNVSIVVDKNAGSWSPKASDYSKE